MIIGQNSNQLILILREGITTYQQQVLLSFINQEYHYSTKDYNEEDT